VFFLQMPRMQNVYHWSPLLTSVHFLPNGVIAMAISTAVALFVKYFSPKWTILGGLTLSFIATVILPFADTADKYWSHLFPAFVM
jgi:fucose permease